MKFKLTCKAFEIQGESITDCVLKWNKYRHNVNDYSDTLIQSIEPMKAAIHLSNIQLGEELFRFASYAQWVNKAQSWFRDLRTGYVCVDSKGRICQIGKQFMRARDDESFPIVVYSIDKARACPDSAYHDSEPRSDAGEAVDERP
jgi:hypothetical protein